MHSIKTDAEWREYINILRNVDWMAVPCRPASMLQLARHVSTLVDEVERLRDVVAKDRAVDAGDRHDGIVAALKAWDADRRSVDLGQS